MYISGSILTKTRFRGTAVRVENCGEVRVFLKEHNEEYRITYPEMHLRGMLSGKIFIEITGETIITSTSGLVANIDHIAKGWFVGEYHALRGSIHYADKENKPLYNLAGKWTELTYAVDPQTKDHIPLSDIQSSTVVYPQCKPIDQQGESESLKVWSSVTQALRSENYQKATQEKTNIEEKQRSLRKDREIDGNSWKPIHFYQTPDSDLPDIDIKEKDKISYCIHIDYPKL